MEEEARDRVLSAMDGDGPTRRANERRRRRGAWPILVAVAVAAVGLALAGRRLSRESAPDDGSAEVLVAEHSTVGGERLGARLGSDTPVEIADDGLLALRLSGGARVDVTGPASIQLREEGGVALLTGQLQVAGDSIVSGAGCVATVRGGASFQRFATHLAIRPMEGGDVEADGPTNTCRLR